MSIEQALLERMRSLTSTQQQAVLDFAIFLGEQRIKRFKPLTPGLHKDLPYMMASDFDAPLSDDFWLGDN